MKIAVISDTHAYEVTEWMEAVYDRYLAGADLLLHCGDTTGHPVWSWLCQHPGFHAVSGNVDDYALTQELDVRVSLRVGGLTVGLVHGFGYGPVDGLSARIAEALGPDYDLVCFGHSHRTEWVRHGSTWMLNPGSLREGGAEPTLAFLHIADDGTIAHEFVSVPLTAAEVRCA
ncbi:hypothetical protein GGQ74_002300 [Desulfobaculum xiamenense]|uniref:Phosphoesterase n=1 Tax=Desulfobaculum xiamenense TaxID=995050 RepID=A0A846QN62_9BACT|nr:metallophosphoesterase family protein [Desulfobaculum xiamenense]NJB68627.1 hypothetical protein [Desulfobaculum xiamenense]